MIALANQSQIVSGEPLLVIAAPWTATASEIVAASSGRVIGPTRPHYAVLTYHDGADYVTDLRAAGAIAVLGGRGFAALCGVAQ